MAPMRTTCGQGVREFPLLACADELGLWRREAAGVAREWRVSAPVVDLVRLGVSELLSNVVKHVPDKNCSLAIYMLGDALVVSVSDSSPVLPEVREAPDWDAESGRGLWICRRWPRRSAVIEWTASSSRSACGSAAA